MGILCNCMCNYMHICVHLCAQLCNCMQMCFANVLYIAYNRDSITLPSCKGAVGFFNDCLKWSRKENKPVGFLHHWQYIKTSLWEMFTFIYRFSRDNTYARIQNQI